MKRVSLYFLIILVLFFPSPFVLSAYGFEDCLNIEGIFKYPPSSFYLKYRQENCHEIFNSLCEKHDGKLKCGKEKKFILDGKDRFCGHDGCTIIRIDAYELHEEHTRGRLFVILDTNNSQNGDHGFCSYKERFFYLDENSNLMQRIPVVVCGDGFQGDLIFRADRIR